jgi:guanylate kinase
MALVEHDEKLAVGGIGILRARSPHDAAIERRFAEAQTEIAFAKTSGVYDAFVVNDDLELAIDQVCDLVRARV